MWQIPMLNGSAPVLNSELAEALILVAIGIPRDIIRCRGRPPPQLIYIPSNTGTAQHISGDIL